MSHDALSEFEGGSLVMYEQGLVLELRAEDIIVFPLVDTTHFNLKYMGH